MSRQPVVLVDMDGVVAHWMDGVFARAALIADEVGFTGDLPTQEGLTAFHMEESFDGAQMDLIRHAMYSAGLYRSLKPVDGAFKALHEMEAAGIHVLMCSTPDPNNPTCASDKLWWMTHYGSKELTLRTILTRDKTTVMGDILIDDKPKIEGFFIPTWQHCIFHLPYNVHVKGLRLNRWADWASVILPALDKLDLANLPAA